MSVKKEVEDENNKGIKDDEEVGVEVTLERRRTKWKKHNQTNQLVGSEEWLITKPEDLQEPEKQDQLKYGISSYYVNWRISCFPKVEFTNLENNFPNFWF